MDIGVSLILIAIGAILAFAVNAQLAGVDINAIGVILMLAGIAGLAISLLFLASFAPFPLFRRRRIESRYYDDYPERPAEPPMVYREGPTVIERPEYDDSGVEDVEVVRRRRRRRAG